jgi:hypothetical protein
MIAWCIARRQLAEGNCFKSEIVRELVTTDLIGITSPEDLDRSPEQDREIEPKAPVVDIPEVIFDAPLDQSRCGRRSPAPVDLCPPRQSGPHAAPQCIITDKLVELAVVRDGMRAWSHK